MLNPFLAFHTYLLCSNKTTLEFCEQNKTKSAKEVEQEAEAEAALASFIHAINLTSQLFSCFRGGDLDTSHVVS